MLNCPNNFGKRKRSNSHIVCLIPFYLKLTFCAFHLIVSFQPESFISKLKRVQTTSSSYLHTKRPSKHFNTPWPVNVFLKVFLYSRQLPSIRNRHTQTLSGVLTRSAVPAENLIKVPVWDRIMSEHCVLAFLLRVISAGMVIHLLKTYHMALASCITHTRFGKTACVTIQRLFLIKKYD